MPHSFTSLLVHVVFSTKDRVDVAGCIAAQQERHRQASFQEEFLSFPRKHGSEYDTRDLWFLTDTRPRQCGARTSARATSSGHL
jgi:hypothetical protein